MTYIACQRCGEPCPHIAALLDHWKVVHGQVPTSHVLPNYTVYQVDGGGNRIGRKIRRRRYIDA